MYWSVLPCDCVDPVGRLEPCRGEAGRVKILKQTLVYAYIKCVSVPECTFYLFYRIRAEVAIDRPSDAPATGDSPLIIPEELAAALGKTLPRVEWLEKTLLPKVATWMKTAAGAGNNEAAA